MAAATAHIASWGFHGLAVDDFQAGISVDTYRLNPYPSLNIDPRAIYERTVAFVRTLVAVAA